MGDLLVWVNGSHNTISGVDNSTTSRDIVIALAQSYGLIGCFNLIEKAPSRERYLHPNERPLMLSQRWGQNSPNCFILRKKVVSPNSSQPSSSSQSSPVRTRPINVASTRPIDVASTRPIDVASTRLVDVASTRPVDVASTRPVDVVSSSGLSSGFTFDSSKKKKGQGPPIVKPKPKLKPKTTSEASKTGEIRPIPVPRKRVLVSPPSSVQEDVFQQSQPQQQIYQKPDILLKSQLPGYSSDNNKPKQPQERQLQSDQSEYGKSKTEDERLKENQDRLRVLEMQRQQQEQVEKALKEKRNRENVGKRQNLWDQKRKKGVDGQRPLKKQGQQLEDENLIVERRVEVEEQSEVQSVLKIRIPDENRRQEDAKKLRELEEAKRLENERKQKERERALLEQKRKEELDRQKELEKKQQAEIEEQRKKELEDRKRQEQERVQALKLKELAEQKENQRQERIQQEEEKREKKRKEMERKKQQQEMERKKQQQEEKERKAEKRREAERKKAIEEEEKQKLADLVKAQECKLNHQQSQLTGLDAAIQALLKFENDPTIDRIQKEISNIEQSIQRNQALLNEKDFWDNELDLERQMHKKLEASVGALKDKVADCNRQISQKQEEIVKLTKRVKKEEKKVTLDKEQAEEVKAVKEELRELKHEYAAITDNLVKVNEKLTGLDENFQEKQKELKLVEGDYERGGKTKELHIIIPDNNLGNEKGSSSPTLHRILKGSPRQLAVATPSTENPEGVFL